MEEICSSETSESLRTTRLYNSEDRNLQFYIDRGWNVRYFVGSGSCDCSNVYLFIFIYGLFSVAASSPNYIAVILRTNNADVGPKSPLSSWVGRHNS
jgi:hypothetical protein